jgi:hypothetical protein
MAKLGALVLLGPIATAQDWALELKTGSQLLFPWDSIMNTGGTATMEGWFRVVGPFSGQMGFTRYQGGAEHKELILRDDGRIAWLYAGQPWAHNGSCRETAPGVFPMDNSWHHVAFVRQGNNTWQIYLDGQNVHGGGPSGCCWLTCSTINASCPSWISGADNVQMRAFRVSSVARYSSNFAPQDTWLSDGDTAMLIPLEEGAGATVFDHGPAAQTGGISGEYEWVALGPDCDTQNYCVGAPNSIGTGAGIASFGAPVLTDNYWGLSVADACPNTPGLFFYGPESAQIPYGDGFLCVGGGATQIYRLAPVISTDDVGRARRRVYLPQPPTGPGGSGEITPGSTWHFQFWYRDTAAGATGFNLSDGLQVAFCP